MEIKGENIDNEYCRRDAPTEDENEDATQTAHSSTLLSEAPLLHSYTLQS